MPQSGHWDDRGREHISFHLVVITKPILCLIGNPTKHHWEWC